VSRFGSFLKGNIGLVDLTERMQPYLKDWVAGRVEQYTYQGRVYAVDTGVCPVVLYYRQDLFEQAGITTPIKTWDDLIAAGQQLKAKTGKYLFALETTDYDAWTPLMLQFGGRFFDESGKVVLDSPQNLKAFTLYVDMVRKYGIAAPAPGGDQYNPSYWAAYTKGDFAAQYGADWMASVMRTSAPDLAGKWRAQPLPTSPDAPVPTSMVGGTAYAITTQSTNVDLAWSLISSMINREALLETWNAGLGSLPAFKPTWDSPDLLKEDPYFGGQRIGQLFIEQAKLLDQPGAPVLPQAPDNPTAYDIFTRAALGPAMDGSRTPEQALKDAADELRRTVGQ
jgi:arabinosaccharide transport system substrate-binding protein